MNALNRFILTICFSTLVIFVAVPPAHAAEMVKGTTGTTRTGHVEFRVGTPESKLVSGARIIIVNPEGKVVSTGLTNASGVWDASLPYQDDARYEQVDPRGIVTAIVVATGYNEQAVFEVPVQQDTVVQPIVLFPLSPNQRNEPTASLGNIHRFTLMNFINRYAKQVGLKRQTPITGNHGYAPWGPEVSNSSVSRGTTR